MCDATSIRRSVSAAFIRKNVNVIKTTMTSRVKHGVEVNIIFKTNGVQPNVKLTRFSGTLLLLLKYVNSLIVTHVSFHNAYVVMYGA